MMRIHLGSTGNKVCLAIVALVGVLGLAIGVGPANAAVKVDPNIAGYQKVDGVDGKIVSIGSDTLNNLMALWTEKFRELYPNVMTEVEGKGSSTAPPALIAGTSNFGPMSRPMKSTEIDDFEKKFGYKPTQIRVAVDALAVFVNKNNPIEGLSLEQVDAIFSSTRAMGGKEDITTWGQLGVTGDLASKPIRIYGRNSASGTYGYFKEVALKKGDYKTSVNEQPGSAAVVQAVAKDTAAIGYSGIGYATVDVKPIALAKDADGELVEATAEQCYAGKYPIARFLNIYINKAPGKPTDTVVKEFVKLVLSQEGQTVVVKDGYYPLPAAIVAKELAKLEE